MHELGITRNIIAEIIDRAKRERMTHIREVTIELGALTNFKKESIIYYYDILKKEHGQLRDATITINEISGKIRCASCKKESFLEDPLAFFCPACDSTEIRIISGKEIIIKNITGE